MRSLVFFVGVWSLVIYATPSMSRLECSVQVSDGSIWAPALRLPLIVSRLHVEYFA